MNAVTKSLATIVFVLALLAAFASSGFKLADNYMSAWGMALICFALFLLSGWLYTYDDSVQEVSAGDAP